MTNGISLVATDSGLGNFLEYVGEAYRRWQNCKLLARKIICDFRCCSIVEGVGIPVRFCVRYLGYG